MVTIWVAKMFWDISGLNDRTDIYIHVTLHCISPVFYYPINSQLQDFPNMLNDRNSKPFLHTKFVFRTEGQNFSTTFKLSLWPLLIWKSYFILYLNICDCLKMFHLNKATWQHNAVPLIPWVVLLRLQTFLFHHTVRSSFL